MPNDGTSELSLADQVSDFFSMDGESHDSPSAVPALEGGDASGGAQESPGEPTAGDDAQATAPEITPELQAIIDAQSEAKIKSFQAQWTQKNQKLSAEAEIGRKILENPALAQALSRLAGMEAPQGNGAGKPAVEDVPTPYQGHNFDALEVKDQATLQHAAWRVLQEQLIPGIKPLVERLARAENALAEIQYERAATKVDGAAGMQAEVNDFFTQNPNFAAGKPTEDRIRLAIGTIAMLKGQAQTNSQAPQVNGASKDSGKPGTTSRNNLAAVLGAQTVRQGAPNPGRVAVDTKGKSPAQYAYELEKATGMSRADLAKLWVRQLSGSE